MTSLAVAPDGTLVAMGLKDGDSSLITTFISSDDGRTWRMRSPAPGPNWLISWNGMLMGFSSGTVPGVWTWGAGG
jgi:hypothetical protein